MIERVDHLIIGAGVAGLVLRRALGSGVVLDPNPAGYKIGESIIPEQFQHPIMRALLPDVEKLPSYSAKIGTTFIGGGAVACFPFGANRQIRGALHVYRSELEQLMVEKWAIEVRRERVLEVDTAARRVRTDRTTYQSDGPLLDCSGPAMVVASLLGEVETLWPVGATWGYWDIEAVDDARFWQQVAKDEMPTSFLDVPSGQLMTGFGPSMLPVSQTTLLHQVEPGTWIWQIPLWHRKVLSVGVVSRNAPLPADAYHAFIEKHAAACYQLRRRTGDPADPRNRVHARAGFARKARRAATADYVLLGDAFAFADPVYSVGSGLATTKALAVADVLLHQPWTAEVAARYSHDYEVLFGEAVKAFDFWYDRSVMSDPGVAVHVQAQFLEGQAFQEGIFQAYAGSVQTAMDAADIWIARTASGLLGDADLAGWTLGRVESTIDRALRLTWHDDRQHHAQLQVALDRPGAPRFLEVAGLALSHVGADGQGDARLPGLLAAMAGRLAARPGEWRALLTAVSEDT